MSEHDTPPNTTPASADATPGSHEPATPPSRRALTIAVIAGAVVLGLGVWLVIAKLPSLLTSRPNDAPVTEQQTAPPMGTRRIHVSLFYVSDSGLELVAVGRDITYGATPAEQARRIVEAQVHLAPAGQVSAIPPETSVHAVYLGSKGEAYVDLGPEIVQHHGGGALNEALAVYAIVNALTTNLQDVRAVQILIDGKEVDTLAGHIDLRRPISKAPDWIQKVGKTGDAAGKPGG